MAHTLANIRNHVIDVITRTDKDDQIDEAINETLREMVAVTAPGVLERQRYIVGVADKEEYPLPDILAIRHPVRVIDPTSDTNNASSHYPMKYITKDEYDLLEPNPNASDIQGGQPWAYTIWRDSLLVTDVPDQIYWFEINVTHEHTNLTSDGDETIFRDQWLETIKAGAVGRMFMLLEQFEKAQAWQALYVNGFSGQGGLNALKRYTIENNMPNLIVKNNNL